MVSDDEIASALVAIQGEHGMANPALVAVSHLIVRVRDAERARMDGNRDTALKLLRDFYVAYFKPEWQEGECADEMTTTVRLFLDAAARDGFEVARVCVAKDGSP